MNIIINKIKLFFSKNWHWVIFSIFVFFCLSFLIFQRGVWEFADSGFFYLDVNKSFQVVSSKFNQFTNYHSFFGFDNASNNFNKIAIDTTIFSLIFLFGSDFGQIIYYLLYFLLIFVFGLKLLKLLFKKNDASIKLGAIFLAFNPFALLLMTLISTSYVYPMSIICIYSFLCYLTTKKIKYLLSIALSLFF